MGSSRTPPLRVLVEAPGPFSFTVRRAAAMTQCDVVQCPGPPGGRTCPLLDGRRCGAITNADVVVTRLGLDQEEVRRVLAGIASLHPDVPVVVLAWKADLSRYAEQLAGVRVVTFPWTLVKVRAAIADVTHATRAADRRG